MVRTLGAALGAAAALWAGAAGAAELRVLEWDGYISPFVEDFDKAAAAAGLDARLVFLEPKLSDPDQVYEAVAGGRCDVVTPTHNYFDLQGQRLKKRLAPLDLARIPNHAAIAPALAGLKYKEHEGKTYAAPLLGGSYGLAYNANKVPRPESWEVLWDPANKGKITVTRDQFQANVYQTLIQLGHPPALVYDIEKLDWTPAAELAAQRKLNALYANVGQFWGGMAEFDDTLLYGTTYWFGVAVANQKGLNWKIAHDLPSTVWLDTMAITPAAAEDPAKEAAAYLLLNLMLSKPIQDRLHKMYGSVMVTAEAEQEVKDLAGFFKEEAMWQPLPPRTDGTFRRMNRRATEGCEDC